MFNNQQYVQSEFRTSSNLRFCGQCQMVTNASAISLCNVSQCIDTAVFVLIDCLVQCELCFLKDDDHLEICRPCTPGVALRKRKDCLRRLFLIFGMCLTGYKEELIWVQVMIVREMISVFVLLT